MIDKDDLKDLLKKNLKIKLKNKDNTISLVDNPMFRVRQNIISVVIEYDGELICEDKVILSD